MRYPHILAAIRSAKWAVTPATLQAIRDVLSSRLAGSAAGPALSAEEHLPTRTRAQVGALAAAARPSAIAVVPVFGIIGKRLSELETACGGVDLENIESALAAAVADPRIREIVIHFDSPGGVVTGVPELAAKIRAWRDTKPIHAFTDTLMASAAYWLASACTSITCTPTADVGSIGVYMALIDESEAWAREGYRLVLIKAGVRKAEGHPGAPIEPETVAALQAEVDAVYSLFARDVIDTRPAITSGTMQGQTFFGEAALQVQLVDALVPDLATLLAQIAEAATPRV